MEETIFLLLAVMGMVISAGVMVGPIDDIFGGLAGALVWGYWALGATEVQLTSDCCVVTESYPGLAVLGGGFAAVHVLILLVGATTVLDPREDRFIEEERT